MENSLLLSQMKSGDQDAILKGLKHKGAIYRINALINIVRYSISSKEIVQMVYNLLKDNVFVDGYKVSDFAYAVLDLIGVKKYSGSDEQISELIDSKLDF